MKIPKFKIDNIFYDDDYFDSCRVRARYPLHKSPCFDELVRACSTYFRNTPKSLYRFLNIWTPSNMDFSDMYKSTIAFINLNGTGIVALDFYKYQLAAYFYVPESELKPQGRGTIIVECGVPGTEHNQFIEGSQAKIEFDRFIAILEVKHDVYPGNNFKV